MTRICHSMKLGRLRKIAVGAIVLVGILSWQGCRPKTDSGEDETGQEEVVEPIEAQKAGVGVGKSSQAMEREGAGRVVASPARTLFRTKEKIVFEIQLPQAMNLYKAEHGKGPQSHEEFMEQIIRRNSIKLPELAPGRHYQFDVEKQELWVVPDESSPK